MLYAKFSERVVTARPGALAMSRAIKGIRLPREGGDPLIRTLDSRLRGNDGGGE